MTAQRRATVVISVLGAVAVTAYATWAAVHILVLNPLVAVPGWELDEIYGAMADAGENFSVAWVLGFLGFGILLAIAAAWVCIAVKAPPIVAASGPLVLLLLGAPACFVASFGPGMSLADTFGISGGSHSPGNLPLYAISALAAVAIIIGGIRAAMTPRYEPAVG